MKNYTIFIFRRDLRIFDNNGLIYAIKNFKNIIPIFIFTPDQITNKNKYKSDNAIQFMIESLKDLDIILKGYGSKLHLFYGDNIKILGRILKILDVDNIIYNMDYTPYAKKRDKKIKIFCESKKINCITIEDYLFKKIGTFNKEDGNPYVIFTPFKKNAMKYKIDKPKNIKVIGLTKTDKLKNMESGYIKYNINKNILVNGGRKNGIKILKNIKNQKNYNKTRNILSIETTLLSAYIKFGCLSIREIYWKVKDILGTGNDLISQLFWHEFYYYIVYYFPKVLHGKNFNPKYDNIKWNINKKYFIKWCNSQTGYPIVDACMKQLNTTGYMHNRGRLITSNFLNRMLGLDWRLGEKYYAKMLSDYDPSINNGNWQWIASTGVDSKPYFQRLFNPWLQGQKYDPDGIYIKKWLPNLKNIPTKELHNWGKYYKNYDLKKINYFSPIVDYKDARKKSINMYKNIKY